MGFFTQGMRQTCSVLLPALKDVPSSLLTEDEALRHNMLPSKKVLSLVI